MNPIFLWLICFAVPTLTAGIIVKILPDNQVGLDKRWLLIIHLGLCISILISQYFIYKLGLNFPWHNNIYSVAIFTVSIIISYFVLAKLGIWYAISTILQQLTLGSIILLLMTSYNLYLIILLIVPIYVWCHSSNSKNILLRTILFTCWGILSVILFYFYKNIFLIASLQTILGAVLVSRKIVYPTR